MVGFGGDKKEEPSDELNVGPEGRERSRCWCLGVETEHLGEWGLKNLGCLLKFYLYREKRKQ